MTRTHASRRAGRTRVADLAVRSPSWLAAPRVAELAAPQVADLAAPQVAEPAAARVAEPSRPRGHEHAALSKSPVSITASVDGRFAAAGRTGKAKRRCRILK